MCIFCRIISGEIPCQKIYEDDKVLAFLDIKPASVGHTLVITKKHYADLGEISEEDLSPLIVVVKKIGELIKTKLGMAGYSVLNNNGTAAGQTVAHIHFHIIPRTNGDGLITWSQRSYDPGEEEEIAKKLTS